MCIVVLPECTSVYQMCGGQQRASDILELELQVIMSSRGGAENKTQILRESSQHCQSLSQLSSP